VVLGCVAALVVACGATVLRGNEVTLSVTVTFACVTLIVAAHLLRGDREQQRSGLLLYTAAACLFSSNSGPVLGQVGERIGGISMWWAVVPLGIVMLTYPGQGFTRRWHGVLIGVVAADFGVLWTVDALLPVMHVLREPVGVVLAVGGVVLPILTCAALVQRWHGAAAPERQGVRSVTIVGLALAVTFAARLFCRGLADLGIVAWPVYEVSRTVNLACLALAPIGLLIEALRRRAARGKMIESLLGVGGDAACVQDAIGRALNDPSVRLALPVQGNNRQVLLDVHGAEIMVAPDRDGRITRDLRSPAGVLVAVVDADEATVRDSAQLRAVLAASALALDNSRLNNQLVQKLHELRCSRSRIVEATVQSRRRLERDLHDGAQQQLLAVAATLARAEILGSDGERSSAIVDARHQLVEAIAELRRLARGIHPALLRRGGLPSALPTLADVVPVPVDLDVPAQLLDIRLSDPVETTLWFVAAEAMTNAGRHSGAGRIRLRLRATTGEVALTVEDNGRGGARMVVGGGLAGLSDRVSALGGALCISSSVTTGTRVEAVLPCES
jgi:signal transduction histidine kinase